MKTSDAVLGALLFGLGLTGCQSPPSPTSTAGLGQPRVISLTPNLTEILFALEAGPQVVGVTRNDHFPPEVDKLPKIGDLQLNYEALLSLHPDLVVYDPALNQQHLTQLQKLGIHLQPLSTQTLDDMQSSILKLGQRLQREPQARQLVAQIQAELEKCRQRSQKLIHHPTALLEIWHDPLMAAGKDTYSSQILQRAGFRNVLDRPGYHTLSLEAVYRLNPEVLILTHPVADELRGQPAWNQLQAVQQGRLLEIPEDLMVRPGPRVIEALRRLQDWLEQHQSGD
ncbi:ABC transporter substrate-binding protein [bacterium]|nr:ABC transporter substrate-binding protein [bacterium]